MGSFPETYIDPSIHLRNRTNILHNFICKGEGKTTQAHRKKNGRKVCTENIKGQNSPKAL